MNSTWFVEDPNCAGPALCSISGVIPIFAIACIAGLALIYIIRFLNIDEWLLSKVKKNE